MNPNRIYSAMCKAASVKKAPNATMLKKKATIQMLLEQCGFVKKAYGIDLTKQADDASASYFAQQNDNLRRLAERDQAEANAEGAKQVQKPMIGAPVPTDAAIESPFESIFDEPKPEEERISNKYPYMYQRAAAQPKSWDGAARGKQVVDNARVFDNALNHVMGRNGGVMNQAAVESARKYQAEELAKQLSAPGTNQYNDAVQMLIQAGRNNQRNFEDKGEVHGTVDDLFFTPIGYEGENRLNPTQKNRLNRLFPAMGDTTNSRRFAGHA